MVDENIKETERRISALEAQLAGMYIYQSGLTGALSDLVKEVKKGDGDPFYAVNFLQGIIDGIVSDYIESESW